MLTRTAIGLGAKPYGLGLWNAGYINALYSKEEQRKLKAYKAKVDPNDIMNPGKNLFHRLKGVLRNALPSGLFQSCDTTPGVYSPGDRQSHFLSCWERTRKSTAWISSSALTRAPSAETAWRCVLPIWSPIMKGRRPRGRSPWPRNCMAGQTVTKEEASAAFLCMHCKACEEICQTNLELMTFWDILEKRLEDQFGRPEAQITEFLKKVDDSKEYWEW